MLRYALAAARATQHDTAARIEGRNARAFCIDRKHKALFPKALRAFADKLFVPECSGIDHHLIRPLRKKSAHLLNRIHPAADREWYEAAGGKFCEIAMELFTLVGQARDIEENDLVDGPRIKEVDRGVGTPNRVRMFKPLALNKHAIAPEETRNEALLKHLC